LAVEFLDWRASAFIGLLEANHMGCKFGNLISQSIHGGVSYLGWSLLIEGQVWGLWFGQNPLGESSGSLLLFAFLGPVVVPVVGYPVVVGS
jgi:hypothetical protein